MKSPNYTPKINIKGLENHAIRILDNVAIALQKAGADTEYVIGYLNKATTGDYDHLIGVTMEYVDVT